MRWNAKIHTTRPPANNKGARTAWDIFIWRENRAVERFREGSYGVATKLPDEPPQKRTPKEMTFKFMDYWVWVMEYENGDYDEIDAITLRGR